MENSKERMLRDTLFFFVKKMQQCGAVVGVTFTVARLMHGHMHIVDL